MASIAQLVSEMAHAVRQPNNKALRENLKLRIIQTRNDVIRRSYENHGYVDKILEKGEPPAYIVSYVAMKMLQLKLGKFKLLR